MLYAMKAIWIDANDLHQSHLLERNQVRDDHSSEQVAEGW